jgi:chaperonin GroES
MAELKPLGNNIIIEVLPEETKTAGGLFLPETTRVTIRRGEVINTPVRKDTQKTYDSEEPINVEKGDVVLFRAEAGTVVKMNNKEYKILSIRDVLGILVEEN